MSTLFVRAFALLWFVVSATGLHAQVPGIINYQGRVAVGTTNFNGSGAFKFALVDTTGATTYWSNDGTSTAGSQPTNAVTLTVTKGLYSVLLGDAMTSHMSVIPANVFTNADVRLRVWFDDGTNGSQLLTPDQRIAAVGYAMVAGTLPSGANLTVGTVTASSFIGNGSGLTGITASSAPNLQQIALLKWGVNSANNTFSVGSGPAGTCFDGASIWVANISSNNVTKLNASTGAVIGTYTVGSPFGICFDGASIWVTNAGSNNVTKLNASTGAAIGTYLVGALPQGICCDGASIWVENSGSNNVTKLNASTGAVIGTYTVGSSPAAICFDGASIWVANGNNNVTKLNANTGAVISTYTVGSGPDAICFDGASIWVANEIGGTVTKLSASTGAVIGTYTVGAAPFGICFDGASIWVANISSNNVTKLNASTGAVIGTYTAGTNPAGICFDGASIWVVNGGSNNVTKL